MLSVHEVDWLHVISTGLTVLANYRITTKDRVILTGHSGQGYTLRDYCKQEVHNGHESLTCRFFTFPLISLFKTIDHRISAIFGPRAII